MARIANPAGPIRANLTEALTQPASMSACGPKISTGIACTARRGAAHGRRGDSHVAR
jgi:hypothetical protein